MNKRQHHAPTPNSTIKMIHWSMWGSVKTLAVLWISRHLSFKLEDRLSSLQRHLPPSQFKSIIHIIILTRMSIKRMIISTTKTKKMMKRTHIHQEQAPSLSTRALKETEAMTLVWDFTTSVSTISNTLSCTGKYHEMRMPHQLLTYTIVTRLSLHQLLNTTLRSPPMRLLPQNNTNQLKIYH